jgi:hypothetical protein
LSSLPGTMWQTITFRNGRKVMTPPWMWVVWGSVSRTVRLAVAGPS